MKSTLLIAALTAGLTGFGWSAVTLRMSSTSQFATNFLSATTGDASARMAWGIVVDTDGSGFKGLDPLTPYVPSFAIAGSSDPIPLSVTPDGVAVIPTTNRLYISSNLMNLTTTSGDGGAVGLNRITNLSNFNYGDGVNQGDAFMIIWFDALALGNPAAKGTGYGMANVPGAAFRALPADPGTHDFFGGWAGPDEPKSMDMVLGTPIPEPSVAILGAIGLLGLLRRRR